MLRPEAIDSPIFLESDKVSFLRNFIRLYIGDSLSYTYEYIYISVYGFDIYWITIFNTSLLPSLSSISNV